MTKSGISSQTWGVKIQRLQGPYDRFVPRVSRDGEFKQADRNWRKTWLHDQHLTSREGSAVDLWDNKEFVKARLNVFRRIWNTPMNLFENGLKAVFNDRML